MNELPHNPTPEERCTWLDSLTPDERAAVHVSQGHRYSLILAALTKRALLSPGIKPVDQLELLEGMHGLKDIYFTSEMLARIEPAGDIECAIVEAADTLDAGLDTPVERVRYGGSFAVLTSSRVFWHFCTLNPSILAAVKMREAAWNNNDVAM